MEPDKTLKGIAEVIQELRLYAEQWDMNEDGDNKELLEIHNEIISLSRHAQIYLEKVCINK